LFYADGRTDEQTDSLNEAVFLCSRIESRGGLVSIHEADVFWIKGKTNITCKEVCDLVTDRKKKTG